jgi:hypothetical protein
MTAVREFQMIGNGRQRYATAAAAAAHSGYWHSGQARVAPELKTIHPVNN